MNYGMRILRDILWMIIWGAGFVIVYRAFADVQLTTTSTNIVLASGALAGLLLGVLSQLGKRLSPDNDKDATAFDKISGTWLLALSDSVPRVSLLAIVAIPIAAGLVHAGIMDGSLPSSKTLIPKAEDALRTVLRLDGDRDGDSIVFDHAAHQQMNGGQDGCATCHHIHRPSDFNSSCYFCHSDMNHSTSIFNHDVHQQRLGDKDSCSQCHDLSKPKSVENAKGCYECHAQDMDMQEPAPGQKYNAMAPSYPNAMHGACVECHRQKADMEGRGCLACCDTCHKAVNHEQEKLKLQ